MTALATVLGETRSVSPLLRRARALGVGTLPELLALAVARGCRHYAVEARPAVCDPGREALPDEDLAILLLLGEHSFEPMAIRCAAQLLGGPGVDAGRLATLAQRERCTRVLAHIAQAGAEHDEVAPAFWSDLVVRIGPVQPVPEGTLPHWTRFVSLSGAQRHSRRQVSVWLRPQR